MFELLNKFKVNPIKVLNKIEKAYPNCRLDIKTISINKKDDEIDNDNLFDHDTLVSTIDFKFKEIKNCITNLVNQNKTNSSALIWSEKSYSNLKEMLCGSFLYRSSEAIIEYMNLQFDNKFKFFEIDWIGDEDPLISLTKLVFENSELIFKFLCSSYQFGVIQAMKYENTIEFSMFVACKSIKSTSIKHSNNKNVDSLSESE